MIAKPRSYRRQLWLMTDGTEVKILLQTEDVARAIAKQHGWDILRCDQVELRHLVNLGAKVIG